MPSQGPTICNSGSGTSWTNPNEVTSTQPIGRASYGVGVNTQTNNLVVQWNAGVFSVPAGATVNGIEIDLEADGPTGSTLYASLSFGGSTESVGLSGSFTAETFGGGSDLWGNASMAPSAVNGAWTVTLYGKSASSPGSFQIYDVTATVTYTDAGGNVVEESYAAGEWWLIPAGADGWW